LFFKFDTDGSGALDSNELYELFKENGVEIDPEIIKEMFNNQAFTLRNFKDINNSPQSLLRFRDIMRKIRNNVKENNNKVFVPFSFESMMQLFG
jgi:Ca2+-binding EF-hand superfamily protein